jgi:methylmalonyl-CoA/ethylmalonyl-CoA epimerase
MQAGTEQKRQSVALEEIGQIGLTVHDLARSTQFYRDVLGMKFLFDAGTMAFFQCGPVRLMIGIGERPASPTGTILYFKVPEIVSTCATLKGRGVEFVQGAHCVAKMPDHELWMAFVKDPEGNTLGLMSEVRNSPMADA